MTATDVTRIILLALAVAAAGGGAIARDSDDDAAGQWIPTGQRITPVAATGATFDELDPGLGDAAKFRVNQAVTAVTSHDGNTLLVLTSGYNLWRDMKSGDLTHKDEYVFVFDVAQGTRQPVQVVKVPNTDSGIVFAPDDQHIYVAGGMDDNIHVFARTGGKWAADGDPIMLGHHGGLGIDVQPSAAGLDVTADGKKLVVADRDNDAVTVVDLAQRAVVGELDLRPGMIDARRRGVAGGEYPYWVKIKGNDTAYVTSMRDGEVDVIDIAGIAGKPALKARIKVGGTPNRMVLDSAQSSLFVASDNADAVTVIDTATNRVREVIDAAAPPGLLARKPHFRGAAPNALALSPDERRLYVTLGGENALAVISLAGKPPHRVAGLVPTGWYPNSVAVSRDGGMLYVVNGRSNPPDRAQGCSVNDPDKSKVDKCRGLNNYILQLSHAGLQALPTPPDQDLRQLTDTVAQNNAFRLRGDPGDRALMAELRKRIKHVIYVIKENRSYDQVLGDLGRGNGDSSLVLFGEAVTPNQHALARQFVTLDNFYAPGEVSGNGWPWSTEARETDISVKALPMLSAGRGLSYDVEGKNRGINVAIGTLAGRRAANPATPDDPDLLPGTADVAAPAPPDGKGGGRLWDAALRANLTVRNYGFYCDDPSAVRLEHEPFKANPKVPMCSPADTALLRRTDVYFRGYDTRYPDFWRATEWRREFDLQVAHRNMPNLTLVRLMTDHMGSFGQAIDKVNTPQRQVADNDYAVGRLIEAVAASRYRDSTLIFVVEDDAQDGPDHLDAHRTTAFVAGPYVKQGTVVSARYTTVNMLRTIEEVLGLQPMSIYDAHQRPMSDIFDLKQEGWSFHAAPSDCLRDTGLTLPAAGGEAAPPPCPGEHAASYWDEQTKGYDWSQEDRIPADAFNRVLWAGLGHGPYPTARSGKDLSHR
jgi:DNA-binding beta-propeller fold protein YncE